MIPGQSSPSLPLFMCKSYFIDLDFNHSSHFRHCIKISFLRSLCSKITGKLFESCTGCDLARMAAVPQGVFAARKVRQAREESRMPWQQKLLMEEETMQSKNHFHHPISSPTVAETTMEQPMQYSSKLMNSIWGLYNRYSVHNFKKNTDGNIFNVGEHQLNAAVSHNPIEGIFHRH